MNPREGIERANRALLDTLHRSLSGPFTAADAAAVLSLDVTRARRLLSYLAGRGWLSRIRHGLYATVPLGATASHLWREDPWIVAHRVFQPCYIAGWSACKHWDLTNQTFAAVCVATGASIRKRTVTIQDASYRLLAMPLDRHFGTVDVWRGQVRISVSDPSRTVVDVLGDPSLCGGICHAADVVTTYLRGEHCATHRLLEYAERVGNRAVYKRLGYIVEERAIEARELVAECIGRKSTGIALLDPARGHRGSIVTRWGLRVNVAPVPQDTQS